MSISLETLKEAVSIKEQIASLEARLAKILRGGGGDAPETFITTQSTPLVKNGRKNMSALTRAKIGAAQKARWAKQKGTVETGERAVVKSVIKAKTQIVA